MGHRQQRNGQYPVVYPEQKPSIEIVVNDLLHGRLEIKPEEGMPVDTVKKGRFGSQLGRNKGRFDAVLVVPGKTGISDDDQTVREGLLGGRHGDPGIACAVRAGFRDYNFKPFCLKNSSRISGDASLSPIKVKVR